MVSTDLSLSSLLVVGKRDYSTSVKVAAHHCAALGIQISLLRGCATVGRKKDFFKETSVGNDPGDTRTELEPGLEPKLLVLNARAKATYTSIQDFRLRLITVGITVPSSLVIS